MRKFIKIAAVGLVFCLLMNSEVFAIKDGSMCMHGYQTFGDYKLVGGVGSYGKLKRYYWVSDAFTNTYKNYIDDAIKEWMDPSATGVKGLTTPISLVKSLRYDSSFRFIPMDLPGDATGLTLQMVYGSSKALELNSDGELQENYDFSYIYLDTIQLSGVIWVQIQATCAHELGHAMGLSHNNKNVKSIMCQLAYGRIANRASLRDYQAINHLYGNDKVPYK